MRGRRRKPSPCDPRQGWLFCPDIGTCPSSCLPDQREWCDRQQAFMYEADPKRRDALIWDFVMSFQDLMRNMVMKRLASWGRRVEAGDVMCHMNLLLYRRFKKAADKGAYYKRVKLKGYINACLGGEIIRLSRINGIDDSWDEARERRHGGRNERKGEA